ncbi:hypothetical protein [Salinarimonas soli]|uniref:Uncharacterized protein n=1 Tax=Salinarimonas soli TaxID=1638099 RepID=A0A5B2VFE5_9HYPH|nr:hypothetical protein [Salinarimonas soli]KAA2237170.1 hypothetical protein F0L46_09140 [Salinarimonas soli]
MSEGAKPPDVIRASLQSGEVLAWWDRPDPRLVGRRELGLEWLFGVLLLHLAFVWIAATVWVGGEAVLLGMPLLAFGTWLVTAPFRTRRAAASMLYALTDQRALILSPTATSAHPLGSIAFVETEAAANGYGHVLFFNEALPVTYRLFHRYGPWTRKSGFIGVAQADRIARDLQDAVAALVGRSTQQQA